jgi:O-antigen/teichoic acid export membrane protein
MQRELHMRDVFFTNLAWFGSMGVLTFWMMSRGLLRSYEDMVLISLTGVSISSLVATILSRNMMQFSRHGTLSLASVLRFGLPQALVMALNNSIRQLDVFLIQPFFGTAASGVYTSAKMLYRAFETITDAGISLMYPTAVRLLTTDRRDNIIIVFSKAISLLLMFTVGSVLVLELGGTSLIVQFLGENYAAASGQMNLILLGTLFLPLFVLQSVELALHKVTRLLAISAASVCIGVITFLVVGLNHSIQLVALGVVTYSASYAIMLLISVRADLHFHLSQLFRTIPDVVSLVRNRGKSNQSGQDTNNQEITVIKG